MPNLTDSPYRDLMRDRHRVVLMLVGAVAKWPPSMLSLALVLAVTDDVGRPTAGWCAMGMALGLATTGPWRGRIVDRRGPRITLLSLVGVQCGLLLLLWLALLSDWTTTALIAICCALGGTTPPVAPVLRSVWGRITSTATQAHAAQAWESVSVDVAYVLAPSLVALVVGLSAPAAVLPVVAVLALVTTVPVGIHAGQSWTHGSARPPGLPGRRPLGVWRVVGVSGMTSGAIVTVELGVVAVAESAGSLAISGVVIALISIGSILGGLAYGHRAPRGRLWSHFTVAATLWVLGCGVAAVTSTRLVPVAVGLTGAGLGFAVLMTVQYQLAGALSPSGRITETFSWMTTTAQLGSAAGAAAGAQLDPRAGFAAAAVLVALAAVVLPRTSTTTLR